MSGQAATQAASQLRRIARREYEDYLEHMAQAECFENPQTFDEVDEIESFCDQLVNDVVPTYRGFNIYHCVSCQQEYFQSLDQCEQCFSPVEDQIGRDTKELLEDLIKGLQNKISLAESRDTADNFIGNPADEERNYQYTISPAPVTQGNSPQLGTAILPSEPIRGNIPFIAQLLERLGTRSDENREDNDWHKYARLRTEDENRIFATIPKGTKGQMFLFPKFVKDGPSFIYQLSEDIKDTPLVLTPGMICSQMLRVIHLDERVRHMYEPQNLKDVINLGSIQLFVRVFADQFEEAASKGDYTSIPYLEFLTIGHKICRNQSKQVYQEMIQTYCAAIEERYRYFMKWNKMRQFNI